jgi:hypothetical protein
MTTCTFGDYIKRIGTSVGVLATLSAAAPLASIIPTDLTTYLFPPLGDLTPMARFICVALVLMVIGCGWIAVGTSKWLKPLIGFATLVFCLALMLYAFFYSEHVIKISTPDTSILVSVGTEKTPFATKTFTKGETDWEMVRHRGFGDEEIESIWTKASVRYARSQLFITYIVALACWAVLFSLVTAIEINSGVKSSTP